MQLKVEVWSLNDSDDVVEVTTHYSQTARYKVTLLNGWDASVKLEVLSIGVKWCRRTGYLDYLQRVNILRRRLGTPGRERWFDAVRALLHGRCRFYFRTPELDHHQLLMLEKIEKYESQERFSVIQLGESSKS